MLTGCASMGIRIEDAWKMTPREYAICVHAISERRKTEQENAVTQAYLSAYWQRVEKLEPLKEIIEKMHNLEPENGTLEGLLEAIKRRNAALGGTVY